MLNQEITQQSIGIYGKRWIDWMENNHKKKVREMKAKNIFLEVAKSVDKYAREYRVLLDRQYEEMHPRPYDPCDEEEQRKWEFTRDFYTYGTVMRERVLIPHTTP